MDLETLQSKAPSDIVRDYFPAARLLDELAKIAPALDEDYIDEDALLARLDIQRDVKWKAKKVRLYFLNIGTTSSVQILKGIFRNL